MTVRGGPSGLYNEEYTVNNVIGTDPLYVGKVRSNGVWLLMKYGVAAGTITYANQSNNAAVSLYADAWTDRATLTYGAFQTLNGV